MKKPTEITITRIPGSEPTGRIILKVNDAGEEAIFYLAPSSHPDYLSIHSVKHYPVEHERAAFPQKFVTSEGQVYLCACGLRVLAPYFVKSKKDLAALFKKFNPSRKRTA